MGHGESFHPSLLLFLFDWWMKSEKSLKRCWRIVRLIPHLYLLHHANGQMHVYLIASFVKIITMQAQCFAVYRFKSTRMVHVEAYICVFLGYDLPIQLLLKLLSSTYGGNRLVDHFHHAPNHITNYKIFNTLCLTK